ncbi:hypothetical protein [Arthrobacter ramosus]|uniref:Uncharacterized protein n=1 Tax=Arthrobacter ramosus TaxID=1672 RepID=A0ABV5XVF2_ARTRM|nr:hypothetical protein [Arthrobacter ramosus]
MRANEQNLNPAPRGRLEKAYESNIGILPAIVIFVVGFFPLRQVLGFWAAIAIVFLLGIASMRIIGLLVAPSIRRRTALDADQGLFECQLREKDSKSAPGSDRSPQVCWALAVKIS